MVPRETLRLGGSPHPPHADLVSLATTLTFVPLCLLLQCQISSQLSAALSCAALWPTAVLHPRSPLLQQGSSPALSHPLRTQTQQCGAGRASNNMGSSPTGELMITAGGYCTPTRCPHLLLPLMTLQSTYGYGPIFIDGETEASRGEVPCPRITARKG